MADLTSERMERIYTDYVVSKMLTAQFVIGITALLIEFMGADSSFGVLLKVISFSIFAVVLGYKVWIISWRFTKTRPRILSGIMLTMAVFFAMAMHKHGSTVMLWAGISVMLNWLVPILIAKAIRNTSLGEFLYRKVEKRIMSEVTEK